MPATPTTTHLSSARSLLPRLGLGLLGAGWIALSATLCGCGIGSGFAMNETGRAYFKQGNYTAAAESFSRATLDDPTNPSYAYNLGKTLHKQGQIEAAEHQYRRALAIDPRHQPSYNGLASLMQQTGRDGEASSLLSAWASTQPHLPAAHIELAALKRQQGDLAGAEQSLRTALSTDPGNTIALAHMGEVMQQKGDGTQAASFYRQSLAKNPFQKRVESRLAAITKPAAPVVRQASYAPAPQMIAGRANPTFAPKASGVKPLIPLAAPPFSPAALTATPYVPSGHQMSAGPNGVSPYRMGPANYIAQTSTGGFGQPMMAQSGQRMSYSTPGVPGGLVPIGATAGPNGAIVTTPLPSFNDSLVSGQVIQTYPAAIPLPAPTVSTPTEGLPAPSLAAPAQQTIVSEETIWNGVEQVGFEVDPAPVEVPAF